MNGNEPFSLKSDKPFELGVVLRIDFTFDHTYNAPIPNCELLRMNYYRNDIS